jgi:hypothetical protein
LHAPCYFGNRQDYPRYRRASKIFRGADARRAVSRVRGQQEFVADEPIFTHPEIYHVPPVSGHSQVSQLNHDGLRAEYLTEKDRRIFKKSVPF